MQSASVKCWVLGASGYTGAELCQLIVSHDHFELAAAFSSSEASAGPLADIYPAFQSDEVDVSLQAWSESMLELAADIDLVFLALPHEASAQIAPALVERGCRVIDLSGAFRLELHNYPTYYGFDHPCPQLLEQAQYILPELYQEPVTLPSLISLPGCYPTAATLALKPVIEAGLCAANASAVVTAVSGVSGAGRKASLATSFCEVSLKPYAVLNHRHQVEIARNLGVEVSFVPQLGNFKRGIVATCWIELKEGVTQQAVDEVFASAYQDAPLVRLRSSAPAVDDVAHSPWCDIYAVVNGRHLVVISALDNLRKGAASQAIQVANLAYQLSTNHGLKIVPKGVVG